MLLPIISIILFLIVFNKASRNRFKMPHRHLPFIVVLLMPIIGPLLFLYFEHKNGYEKQEFFHEKKRFSK